MNHWMSWKEGRPAYITAIHPSSEQDGTRDYTVRGVGIFTLNSSGFYEQSNLRDK
jgi:hypothetical protein